MTKKQKYKTMVNDFCGAYHILRIIKNDNGSSDRKGSTTNKHTYIQKSNPPL